MKLLQNSVGNFLNMAPQEAKKFAQQLLDAAEKCSLTPEGRPSGFVQTIVLTERGNYHSVLDTVFVGVSKHHFDVYATLEKALQPRSEHILNIKREEVNVQLKEPHNAGANNEGS